MSLILASQSPRRKQLLEWAEIDFTVIVKVQMKHIRQAFQLPMYQYLLLEKKL